MESSNELNEIPPIPTMSSSSTSLRSRLACLALVVFHSPGIRTRRPSVPGEIRDAPGRRPHPAPLRGPGMTGASAGYLPRQTTGGSVHTEPVPALQSCSLYYIMVSLASPRRARRRHCPKHAASSVTGYRTDIRSTHHVPV